VREGLRYALGEPTLRVVLAVMAVFGLLALNFQVLLPLVAKKVFDGGAGAYGALSTTMGLGSLCGSLVAAGRGRASTRLMAGACLAVGISMAGAALAPNLAVALVLWFVVGAATMTLMSTSNTTLQLTSRADMRGRVISLYMLLVMGTTPVGGPIVGWVAQRAGTRWAIALGAAASLCGAAIAARGGRQQHGHPPTAHDDEGFETSEAVRPAAATVPVSTA
jgi:MFS family permease